MSPDARTASPSSLTPSSILTDEAALKREFDAQFASSLAAARAQLGDDATAMAPRVVETAFVECVESTRHDRHGGSTQDRADGRDPSRRGARAQSSSLRGTFRRRKADAERRTPPRPKRRPTCGRTSKRRSTRPSSVERPRGARDDWSARSGEPHEIGRQTAVVDRACGDRRVRSRGVGRWNALPRSTRRGRRRARRSSASAAIQPIASQPGQIGSTTLGDGSKMKMGPETKVFIPDAFPDKARVIKVEGTAQFEVAKSPRQAASVPRHRQARSRDRDRNELRRVGVRERQRHDGAREGGIGHGQGGQDVDDGAGRPGSARREQRSAPADRGRARSGASGGSTDRSASQHKQLRAVVAALTRWFNYDVKVPDLPLLDRDASINVPLDSSRLAISQVEKSANVKFTYEGETKVFRDANAKKK